jgi:uncharacterized 2Fe-2S/4Fe-4S cluster protein (DUF4445 family)
MNDRSAESHTVRFLPEGKEAAVRAGRTILDAAEHAGVYVNSICGGNGVCGKCRVIVREGKVDSPPTPLLDEESRRRGAVLACQSRVFGNLSIEVPPETRLMGTPAGAAVTREAENEYAFDPLSRKLFLPLPLPGRVDTASDLDRVCMELSKRLPGAEVRIGLDDLSGLAGLLRRNDFRITAALGRRGKTVEIIRLEAGDTSSANYGVAVDIGTTTIVADLIDMSSGKVVARRAAYNSQIPFGEDVITRILYADERPGGLKRLHDCVAKDINGLVNAMGEEAGVSRDGITCVVAAGNTVMTHLLLGLEVSNIRKDPYIPCAIRIPAVRAAEAGTEINGRALLHCLPGAGPFVGGDVTADVVSSGMHRGKELALLFDLGTNGEVVLGNSEWLIACSASAGPAFEGGGLSCGIRATDGAIERVAINREGKISCKTIGGARPTGICGSGMIDLAAQLLLSGLLDKSGRFRERTVERQGSAANPYLKEGDNGPELVIVPAKSSGTGRAVSVNEDDLAVFIRSKGAIYTAAEALLSRVGISFRDVRRVFISGGFGNCVDVVNAIVIGLLPDLPMDRFSFIGNGSLNGARLCLSSRRALEEAEETASRMTYFELSTDPKFMGDYTSSLFLPHTDVERFPSVMRRLEGSAP